MVFITRRLPIDSDDPLVQWYSNYSKEALEKFKVNIPGLINSYKTGLFEPIDKIKDFSLQGETPWPVTYLFYA